MPSLKELGWPQVSVEFKDHAQVTSKKDHVFDKGVVFKANVKLPAEIRRGFVHCDLPNVKKAGPLSNQRAAAATMVLLHGCSRGFAPVSMAWAGKIKSNVRVGQ